MRQPTKMMQSILTDETAQKIIDFVSPIYGNSYVGLWMFQAIGTILGEVLGISSAVRYETSPATSTLMLDYWEDHYGLPRDSSLTIEQRRSRLVRKIYYRGPCNPAVMAAAVSSALGGIRVEIKENVAKNKFTVLLYEPVEDVSPAVPVLERMKPAHLIYEIRMASPTPINVEVNVGVAVAQSENFFVEVTE